MRNTYEYITIYFRMSLNFCWQLIMYVFCHEIMFQSREINMQLVISIIFSNTNCCKMVSSFIHYTKKCKTRMLLKNEVKETWNIKESTATTWPLFRDTCYSKTQNRTLDIDVNITYTWHYTLKSCRLQHARICTIFELRHMESVLNRVVEDNWYNRMGCYFTCKENCTLKFVHTMLRFHTLM